jgi:hypothetical protein
VAKNAGEEEAYADIRYLQLALQVCGKEGWPGGKSEEEEEVYADIILGLVVQVCGKEGWPGRQDGGGGGGGLY